ncbi:MAG: prepilin-type N-terminal cleavage/methylation domain-containing protein [Candidatus Omnitrophica bacterium]|nr:prepilin-type N-terminal cleavage/methylation domain-containing protein [Candidatus Omnitrophota bacterium]
MFKPKTGFTLIEIMMVMAIVSLLVSVAIVEGVQFRKQANESNCMANLKAIASGFEVYSARHAGVYAPAEETNLQFLIDDNCLFQDLISIGQIGNFRYIINSVNPAGYDIKALSVNPALADHNYQISTGGILKRSDTSVSNDMDFKDF